jgi:hypothetical protein
VNIAAATAAVSRLARARMASADTSTATATSNSLAGVTISNEGSSLNLGSIAHELAAFKQRIAKLERGSCSDSEQSFVDENNIRADTTTNDYSDQVYNVASLIYYFTYEKSMHTVV